MNNISKKQLFNLCKFNNVYYCTKNSLYKNTILLPHTKLPLRLTKQKLIKRDKEINKIACIDELYLWQKDNLNEPEFILHDGPPFANGKPHMGHAINKILKDTILRTHILNGNKVHYVPGWDCHGLPIEYKVVSKLEKLTSLEIRKKARQLAEDAIDEQKKIFKSWGIIGDWNNSYKTFTPNYLKNQFKKFLQLYKNNLIYRDFKPIYWSPSTRTALAEAELEYNENHKSPSLFIRFELCDFPQKENYKEKVYALIWTTTPWTLPSNQAICYNSELNYCLVKNSKDNSLYIVANNLIENLSKTFNCNYEIIDKFSNENFNKSTYIHPIFNSKKLNFFPASHANDLKGTGLVHTAPAHGPDDFLIALSNKIPINNLVREDGCFNKEAGDNLEGKFVLTDGTNSVLKLIEKDIIYLTEIIHSYPYDWRSKQPIIIRASQQWFFNTEILKERAIECLKDVEILPKSNGQIYKENLIKQIKKRPYWCISRQRNWGVPIPVLYKIDNNEILINEELIDYYTILIDKHGTDFWWKLEINDLIPSLMNINFDEYKKGNDILDVWFDSGISWTMALNNNKIADLYLEGVDQITGWFQSSLITSIALENRAPFKQIYIHGFAVDNNGVKMSKSLGNIINPTDITDSNGVDTLRWWVACHANHDPIIQINDNVLKSCSDEIQKIRNTLRFALASLENYRPPNKLYEDFSILDKYMLHILWEFYYKSKIHLKSYEFNKISLLVLNLLTNSISALYYTGIKDRLYCNYEDDDDRRVVQYVLLRIFYIVSEIIAPIIPHLIEELYLYLPFKSDGIFFKNQQLIIPESNWKNENIQNLFDLLLKIKKDINKLTGSDSLSYNVTININNSILKNLNLNLNMDKLEIELRDIFQVSNILFNENNNIENYKVEIFKSDKYSCPRCRKINTNNPNILCERCNEIIILKRKNE